jgi:hypothetical protein
MGYLMMEKVADVIVEVVVARKDHARKTMGMTWVIGAELSTA